MGPWGASFLYDGISTQSILGNVDSLWAHEGHLFNPIQRIQHTAFLEWWYVMGHERHYLTLCRRDSTQSILGNDDTSWAQGRHFFNPMPAEINTQRSWNADKSWAHKGHLLTLFNIIQHTAFSNMMVRHGPMSAIFLTLYNGIHHTAFLVMMIHHGPMRSINLTLYFNTKPSLKWWHLIGPSGAFFNIYDVYNHAERRQFIFYRKTFNRLLLKYVSAHFSL